jgi:soluble lytic murein transglycosylase-like protein
VTCPRGSHTAIICLAGLLLFILSEVESAGADIFVYTDQKGVRHYTNVPASSRYRPYIRGKSESFAAVLPDRYDHLIRKASKAHGVSFNLVKAMIKVESDFNPKAVSRAGALGLMQIMPANLKHLKIDDPFDPSDNIMGGTKYMKYLLNRFDGRVSMALAAYNAGPNRVEKLNRIPPFPETQNYVKRVVKYYRIIRNQ